MFKRSIIIFSIVLILLPLIVLVCLIGIVDITANTAANSVASYNTQNIPSQYQDSVKKAGSMCSQITSSIVAAQIEVESNWNPKAVSNVGAEGIAQFMPDTYKYYGAKNTTPYDPNASIEALGKYDCYLFSVFNDVNYALASYNTGIQYIKDNKYVIPSGVQEGYVNKILSLARTKYSASSQAGQIAVDTAMKALGTPYHLDGDCTDPHNGDLNKECDCASLIQIAYKAAGINLPRTSGDQFNHGTIVEYTSQLQVGDLVFSNWEGGNFPGHVVMYIGNGEIIEAPHTGDIVKIVPLSVEVGHIVGMKHITN